MFQYLCLFSIYFVTKGHTISDESGQIHELVAELKLNNARLSVLENKVSFLEKENSNLRHQMSEISKRFVFKLTSCKNVFTIVVMSFLVL